MHDKKGLFFHKLRNRKACHFCSAKDTFSILQKSNFISCLTCYGCNKKNIGKTDLNLMTPLPEHDSCDDQSMHQHISKCACFPSQHLPAQS